MGVCYSKDKIQSNAVRNFLLMFKTKPIEATIKYKGNLEKLIILDRCLSSEIFGGTVLLPIGSQEEKIRNKPNPLYDYIIKMDTSENPGQRDPIIDPLKAGGFYHLENVVVDEQNKVFADIWFLLKRIRDQEVAQLMVDHSRIDLYTGLPKKRSAVIPSN